jgi:hypothetical protein
MKNKGICSKIMLENYISLGSIKEWIINDVKGYGGSSIILKEMVRGFPLIGKQTVGK